MEDEERVITPLPKAMPIIALILLVLGLALSPFIQDIFAEEQLNKNPLLSGIPFLLVFISIILFFMSFTWWVSNRLNFRVSDKAYQIIEKITIGGIVLGSTMAGTVITPINLVNGATDATDPVVKNIVRLLVTFDADGDPSNGIDVTAAATMAMGSTVMVNSPSFETDVTPLVIAVKGAGAMLVDETTALAHFNTSLQTNWGTSIWGTDCWGTVCS